MQFRMPIKRADDMRRVLEAANACRFLFTGDFQKKIAGMTPKAARKLKSHIYSLAEFANGLRDCPCEVIGVSGAESHKP